MLVSIITPSYNSEQFISETINSVISQTYQNLEMIIVDDNSKDGSVKLIKEFCEKDERIKLIELNTNVGAAQARNAALQKAQGRFIAFLDSDDFWFPMKLEKQIAFMLNNNYEISFTAYEVMSEDLSEKFYTINVPQKIDYKGYLKNTIIGMSSSVIDKKIVGEFSFINIRTRQDTYLWISLLKKGFYAYGLNTTFMRYRKREDSISANKFKAIKQVWYLYYNLEKLGLIKSFYYFSSYAFNALFKRIK